MKATCIVCGILAMIGIGAIGVYLHVPYSGPLLVYGCTAALFHDW